MGALLSRHENYALLHTIRSFSSLLCRLFLRGLGPLLQLLVLALFALLYFLFFVFLLHAIAGSGQGLVDSLKVRLSCIRRRASGRSLILRPQTRAFWFFLFFLTRAFVYIVNCELCSCLCVIFVCLRLGVPACVLFPSTLSEACSLR
jgi:hypothetical protein